VGRLDSRFKGVEALAVNEKPEFDPSMLAIKPPYTTTFNDYLRSQLGVECDLTYRVLNSKVGEEWGWEKGSLPSTGESLRGAMAKNPYMKVLVGQGYYDLATPHFATLYMISHMNIDPDLRDNVRIEYYRAGHMYYLDLVSLKASTNHVREFFSSAVPRLEDL
jgi:carboxypeptidase C (cathepsin A)